MIIGNKFEVGDLIDKGTYSSVYHATDKDGNNFAVKCETSSAPKLVLHHEARIYRRIRYCTMSKYNDSYPRGIPRVYHFQVLEDRGARVLVLERLGVSLNSIQRKNCTAFSVATALRVAIQMLNRLELLHEMNIVHRDIKPENMLVGFGEKKNTIYICDFGLSRIFRDEFGKHIPDIFGERFSGLHFFAPINAHLGKAQSQRDDLESLGYCIIFFATLKLPWAPAKGRYNDEEMGKMKSEVNIDALCEGLPKSFAWYLWEVKNLGFMEKPNYVKLRKILYDDLIRLGEENSKFDWDQ